MASPRPPDGRAVASGERSWDNEEPTWGMWGVTESELRLLPDDLAGTDAIELGCGTAYVSAWMARRGARVVGIDNSAAQLATARRLQIEHALDFPQQLVRIGRDLKRMRQQHGLDRIACKWQRVIVRTDCALAVRVRRDPPVMLRACRLTQPRRLAPAADLQHLEAENVCKHVRHHGRLELEDSLAER